MIDWNKITYDDLKSMQFESVDPEDAGFNRGSLHENTGAFRATPGQITAFGNTEEQNLLNIRKMIQEYIHAKIRDADNIYLVGVFDNSSGQASSMQRFNNVILTLSDGSYAA